MKRMICGLLAVVGLSLAVPAKADQGWTSFGCTNTVKASTGVTAAGVIGSPILISKEDNAGLWLDMQGDAAGTGAITVTFARVYNGTNVETSPRFSFITALNGNTRVQSYTNLNNVLIGACEGIQIFAITNADGTANATNFNLYLTRKTVKPSP